MSEKIISFKRALRVNLHLLMSYLRVNWRLFLVAVIFGLLLIYILPSILEMSFPNRGTTIGLVGNYTINSLPNNVAQEVSFGLTTLTADGQATQGAALSWELSNSDKTITFHLDKNLFWQDGTKFDSSQVNYNLKGVTVRRLDLYTLQFNFSEPFSPLPVVVSQPLFKNGLIGLGKYKIQTVNLSGRFLSGLTLEDTTSGEKKFYKYYSGEKIAALALKLGAVDKVENLHEAFSLDKDKHYRVTPTLFTSSLATVFLNLHKDRFADKNFRQALAYALPDEFSQGEMAFSPISKSSWAFSGNAKVYHHNLVLAKNDMAKIASSSGQIKFTISTVPQLRDVAEIVAKDWRQIGLGVEVETVDTLPVNYDVFLDYLNLPADPDQYALWHSTQTGNISGYKSFKVDRLLEDGRRTFALKSRKDIYAAFERAITEDVPAIFLFYPRMYTISRRS